MRKIELRSDTFTKPSSEMLKFMFDAEVGDDVWLEDESVKSLEVKIASIFGMEAAIFCPSGTMANQIAIKVHTQPGDEVICDATSHIYYYEGGGIAFNSSASVKLLNGKNGILSVPLIKAALREDNVHFPTTSLVCVENTTNKGGGACYEIANLKKLSSFCKNKNFSFHMDGARLFNAIVKTQTDPKDYGSIFDSISVCISKGLGAPVGSLLLGSSDFINKARRVRKVFGGGMRQAGYLAAAGTYALNFNIPLLIQDHRRAKELSDILSNMKTVKSILPVETNIVIFTVDNSSHLVSYLKEKNILCSALGSNQIRFVTHLQFDDQMLKEVKKALLSYS
tara:strand:- start:6907 stop:7920 length:1014 start_codon:yes stop_codon:yes gene_type:complete